MQLSRLSPTPCSNLSPAPSCPPLLPAVVKRLPNLQSLQLPHNRLGGQLTCELLGPQGGLASLDFTGGDDRVLMA